MSGVEAIAWKNDQIVMIDQRKLPLREVYITCKTHKAVIRAIKSLVIRGAPAIGVAAAMGIALGALKIRSQNLDIFEKKFDAICRDMVRARPTAVNLAWAVTRMKERFAQNREKGIDAIKTFLVEEAQMILDEDVAMNRVMGHHGQKLLKNGSRILTHCNTGALATGGYGTALGVVRAAIRAGKTVEVFADETRPFLQGARLTTWELIQEKIPVTLITDNASGYFMQKEQIDAVIVGADRIAANGDVANKIGTYMVAVLAKTHDIPFYVAAPMSTIDYTIKNGREIPIEHRSPEEITHLYGKRLAPAGVKARNPVFDITPHPFISAIITERGVVRAPYMENLENLRQS